MEVLRTTIKGNVFRAIPDGTYCTCYPRYILQILRKDWVKVNDYPTIERVKAALSEYANS